MSRENVVDQLTQIFREVFDDDTIVLKDDMTADDVDGWDSLTHLRLIMQVEKVFDIKFSTNQLKSFGSAGDLISLIKEKKEE